MSEWDDPLLRNYRGPSKRTRELAAKTKGQRPLTTDEQMRLGRELLDQPSLLTEPRWIEFTGDDGATLAVGFNVAADCVIKAGRDQADVNDFINRFEEFLNGKCNSEEESTVGQSVGNDRREQREVSTSVSG